MKITKTVTLESHLPEIVTFSAPSLCFGVNSVMNLI